MAIGITQEELVQQYPRLYHMAAAGSWPSIQQHGLLSTTALLDLFEKSGPERAVLETTCRPNTVAICHHRHGAASIRDQKPMSVPRLEKLLDDGLTPAKWCLLLNRKVFFWVSEIRLGRLMATKGYRTQRNTLITLDTKSLITRYSERVALSPINSGCTWPSPARRGKSTFLPLAEYPYEYWLSKRGRGDAIVELTVDYAVTDIDDLVIKVMEVGGDIADQTLYGI